MRMTGIAIMLVLGLALAVGAATSGRPLTAAPKATISQLGLEGLGEVYVQVEVLGSPEWQAIVGITKEQLEVSVKERLSRIPGLTVLKEQEWSKPRLLLQVVGHVVQGYDESDPPTATNLMLAVAQPVTLNRPGPGGERVVTSGITLHTNLLTTRRASAAKQTVEEKIGHLLEGFEEEYLRANATAGGRPPAGLPGQGGGPRWGPLRDLATMSKAPSGPGTGLRRAPGGNDHAEDQAQSRC